MTTRSDEASLEVQQAAPDTGSGLRPVDPSFERLVTIVSLACLVAFVVGVAVYAARPLSNADTWFHLRIGHELWGPWSIAHPGSLSRYATQGWVPTQWATEMLLAKVEDWFGLPGLAWLFGVLYVTLVLVVYFSCRQGADVLSSTVVTGAALISSAALLSVRPQVLSLILFVLTAMRWERARRDGRVPWLLVPLTWVWACIHGLWSAGVLLGLVTCIGLLLDAPRGRRPWRMLAVPLASLAAAALTPVGPRLLFSQVAVSQRAGFVTEWMPTSFRTAPALVVAAMAGVLLILWSRRGRIPWTLLLTLLLACGWAALVTRMVAFAAVLVAPSLAAELARLRRPGPAAATVRAERRTVIGTALVVVALVAVAVPHTASRPGGVPGKFAPRLAALPAGSGVLVEDAVGAWIEYRFPHLDPTLDGLFDAYSVAYLRRFAAAQAVKAGWTSYVRETDPTVAILDRGSALATAMEHRLHWRQVAHDGVWVYLVPPTGEQS